VTRPAIEPTPFVTVTREPKWPPSFVVFDSIQFRPACVVLHGAFRLSKNNYFEPACWCIHDVVITAINNSVYRYTVKTLVTFLYTKCANRLIGNERTYKDVLLVDFTIRISYNVIVVPGRTFYMYHAPACIGVNDTRINIWSPVRAIFVKKKIRVFFEYAAVLCCVYTCPG